MRRAHTGNFGTFTRSLHEPVQILREKNRVLFAGAVLQHEGEPAGRADAGNGRRRKREGRRFGQFSQFTVQVRADRSILFFRLFAFLALLCGNPV